MDAFESLRGQPNSPEYEFVRIERQGNIDMLDESAMLLDYEAIPPGSGFTLLERSENGLQAVEFYRDIKLGGDIDTPHAPEWYIVAGEGEDRTLWPVILHGSASPNGFTKVAEVREDMPFYYQGYVTFEGEHDAPPPDRFVRPKAYEHQPLPLPSDLSEKERAEYISNGQIIISEDGQLRWFLPGMLFVTGPVKHVDF